MSPRVRLWLLTSLFFSMLAIGYAGCKKPAGSGSGSSAGSAAAGTGSAAQDLRAYDEVAVDSVRTLLAGHFARLRQRFSKRMRAAVGEASLRRSYGKVSTLGKLRGVRAVKRQRKGKLVRVWVRADYAGVELSVGLVLDPSMRIVGMRSMPPKVKHPPWKAPSYVAMDKVTVEPFTVGKGELALPGKLCLPRGAKRVPAVVLVHGSGPQDMDETIGASKVFKDLCLGLASAGVAALRYTKLTKAHPVAGRKRWGKYPNPEHETTIDALLAVKQLRAHARVDPKRVFFVGHSQGALMAPLAGKQDPKIAGLVLMASPARPWHVLTLAQLEYIANAGGPQGPALKKMLPKLRKQIALAASDKLTRDTPRSELPLGMPASFWLYLRRYKQLRVAKAIKQPMLILQGEADYQVTMADFALWKKALAKRPKTTFKSYPKLAHSFVDVGKKMSVPMDYHKPGHVLPAVVADIAKWVKAQK